ncbi:PEPxxWA-CTERM sorting domain-containing protein [Phenylobacterium sp.]|uniref:PEPxxWA-CTERM sorting domain-containing protein n=1 Tax=Phenylobacterium sp. TaxID=1871053 RepID=UPI001228FB2E|nr:PEPxxWA-CTERM sorting domain-containing protein [Phenylobacterium sp.]THD65933.1 MAG: PEP-CTERM sorting domain-containing protein [Phenylobacterium sp.]
MRRSLLLALAASATVLAGQAAASQYVYTSIPEPGYPVTGVAGLNDSGQVIVDYGNPSGQGSFIYQGGVQTQITPPLIPNGGNHVNASAAAINSSGTVVGTDIQTTNGVGNIFDFEGFVDHAGVYSFVSVPGAVDTQLTGINNAGVVLGKYETASSNGVFTYFTETGGNFTTIGSPGLSQVTAVGIDSAGDVVGNATYQNARVGFIDSGGVYSLLSAPGSQGSTSIQAVSESGLIAGNFFANGRDIGFIDDGGTFTDVQPQNATITEITGINDSGTVVGTANHQSFVDADGTYTMLSLPGPGFDPNNNQGVNSINDAGLIGGSYYSGNGFNYQYTAFIASPASETPPVPEPATWSLLIGGFALTGAALRRRRQASATATATATAA